MKTSAVVMLLCLSLSSVAAAQSEPSLPPETEPVARGAAIARAADDQDRGFGHSVSRLNMVLVNEEGRTRTRQLTAKTLEQVEGDKSLVIFHEPRDIAGTALLSHSQPSGEDDQWLYLPALRRVKRIASANRSGSFVGSEFSYEDLLPERVEDFDHRWLRDEACGDWQCFVIERRPLYEDSGYARQIVWLDQDSYRLVQIDYYDRKGRSLKTLNASDYQVYLDHYWRAHSLTMVNHLSHKTTRLTFSEYDFDAGLDERDFRPGALRRLR